MWVLSSQSNIFHGKRLWITPGSRHIIGRTPSNKQSKSNDVEDPVIPSAPRPVAFLGSSGFLGINHHSVSRKHLQIFVDPVVEGSSTDLHSRSALWLEESSKVGTWISENESDFNGDIKEKRIETGKKVQVTASKMYIKLGGWDKLMVVEWVPVSLALTHLSKRHLDRGMKTVREKLEPFDIKISATLQGDSTTHVVCRTRNTPPVLEGLVRGKYIVSEGYIDALVDALAPKARPGSTGQSLQSSLEKDFDGSFPNPMEYVPAPGKEPVPRPSEFLRPTADRSNMFHGLTFIFYEEDQRSTLRTPIEVGRGKTTCYPSFAVNVTIPQDFAAFVKSCTDTASANEPQGSNPKSVVVRPPLNDDPGPALEWKRSFLQQVDLILGQRSIVQNEFLDAILTSSAGSLCQPLQEVGVTPNTRDTSKKSSPVQPRTKQASPVSRNQPAEQGHVSRDASEGRRQDGDAVTNIPPSDQAEAAPLPKQSSSRKFRFTQAKSRFKGFDDFDSPAVLTLPDYPDNPDAQESEAVNQADERRHESLAEASHAAHNVKQRKRPAPNAIESLLPATTAVKRRRIETGKDRGQEDISLSQENDKLKPSKVFRKTTVRRGRNDGTDMMDAARAMREYEQEQARLDEEVDSKPLEQNEMRQIRQQIIVQDMPIRMPLREDRNGQWEEEWNGRKNFKKFRRKGSGPQPIRGHRVIVRLEEAKRRDPALGSVRWSGTGILQNSSSTARDVEEEDDSQFRRRSRVFQDPESHQVSMDSEAFQLEEDILKTSSRQGGNAQLSIVSSITRSTKRSAVTKISPPPKRISRRGRTAPVADESSEGSEDELRFRFSRRLGNAE